MPSRPRFVTFAAGASAALAGWSLLRRRIDLEGKVVFITGGSRGLGLLIARELASRGARLAICARDPRELDLARHELEQRGVEVLALRCDVSNEQEITNAIDAAVECFGRLDGLINNASIIRVGPVATMDVKDFQDVMAANFWGTLYATRAAIPHMKSQGGGRIVNITSIGAKVAIPHLLPYDCAKFAALGLSEGLRAELARHRIRVTSVVPGLMRTGSPVNAEFKGRQEAEYGWFTLGDALPVSSMHGRRAARRIVQALIRGEAFVTLSWQAKILRVVHDLFPGVTADVLGLVNTLLPGEPDAHTSPRRGRALSNPLPKLVRVLVDRAARNNNELTGRLPDPV